jgi:hypothetical protein
VRGAGAVARPSPARAGLTRRPAAVALAAYRERVRRFAAYLVEHRLPRLSRVLLSHHWSAWAAVFGAPARPSCIRHVALQQPRSPPGSQRRAAPRLRMAPTPRAPAAPRRRRGALQRFSVL